MVIVLMGVTGSGKTTVGQLLASQLDWNFFDADDFHPPSNKTKMSQGIPLTDEDRIPWLETLRELIAQSHDEDRNIVLACSALKHDYRKILRHDLKPVRFVYLRGSKELISSRLSARKHEFMNPELLDSQFNTLQEPQDALYIDINPTPPLIVTEIRSGLGL